MNPEIRVVFSGEHGFGHYSFDLLKDWYSFWKSDIDEHLCEIIKCAFLFEEDFEAVTCNESR